MACGRAGGAGILRCRVEHCPGLGRKQRRRVGRRDHHQQKHTRQGQPAPGHHNYHLGRRRPQYGPGRTTPTSTTTLQVTPANPTADQDITLTATVTCNVDTPTGTITFHTNTTTLATVPLTTSATHTTTLPTGTHTLTAHYTSTNTCPNSQSPPTTITINPDLPITGPTLTTTTIGAATLSILAGTTLIYAARRRRPAPRHLR